MKTKDNQITPKLRFKEFSNINDIVFKLGNELFDSISDKKHNSDLPILAITQENGAIPRNQIDYNVSVTAKSIASYKVVNIGDFIISLRSFQGGIEYSKYKGICSPAYIVLRKKIELVNKYYTYYFKTNKFIQDMNKDLEGIRDGKMVSYIQFSKLCIPYPKPKEQEKIADCLTSLDELICLEDKKLKELEKHKKGLMQELFPTEGKTMPEWRFPEFRNDEDWEEKGVGDSCKTFSGGTPITSKKNYYNGKIPFIRSAEIDQKSTELNISQEGLNNSSAKMVKKGDVLVALYGANSGDVALSKINGAINQAILCLKHETCNSFMCQYLAHKKRWIISTYVQGGQGNLSGDIIKSLILYFPKDPKEQQKIADCLSSVDDLISEQSNKIAELKEHKKGLLQGLFPSLEEVER